LTQLNVNKAQTFVTRAITAKASNLIGQLKVEHLTPT